MVCGVCACMYVQVVVSIDGVWGVRVHVCSGCYFMIDVMVCGVCACFYVQVVVS